MAGVFESYATTQFGFTQLMQAAQRDNVMPIKALLKYGADVNAQDFGKDDLSGITPVDYTGETALMKAVIKGNLNKLQQTEKNSDSTFLQREEGCVFTRKAHIEIIY